MERKNKTPKVTLLSWTRNPMETIYAVWQASKNEEPLFIPGDIAMCDLVTKDELRKLFRAVIAQRIPVGEHVDMVFMIENISVSWREQAVRHRIGVEISPERLGVDITPDLAKSSWWSQCFVGDTRIKLLDGTSPTIEELADRCDEEFWVYSCTMDGKIVPGRAHSARRTNVVNELVEVELDNGVKFKCTPDHLWMRKNGEYVEASKLESGVSLMPLYTKLDKYGYERVLNNSTNRYILTHKRVFEELHGKLLKNEVIHHASFDKLNNDPRYLEKLNKVDHIKLHADTVVKRMVEEPDLHREVLSGAQRRWWKEASEKDKLDRLEQLKIARNSIDSEKRNVAAKSEMDTRWKDESWRNKMLPILAKNGVKTKGRKLTPETKEKMREAAKQRIARDGFVVAGRNHTVVSVRRIRECAVVYDITVDKYHNFALDGGVFVHNSMRIQNMGQFADNRAYRVPSTLEGKRVSEGQSAEWVYRDTMKTIQRAYNDLVEAGVPMEDARELIPLGAQHRISWKLNIGALQHIVGKRGCWILQLGIWGPVIMGMIDECAKKIDSVFRELVCPPCCDDDGFKACIYKEECRRRLDGGDQLPPCPLHYFQEDEKWRNVDQLLNRQGDFEKLLEADGIPMAKEVAGRAKQYREFWGRNPYTGEKE